MAQQDQECQDNRFIVDGVIDQKYRVLDYVGGGGMACVYQVRTFDNPHRYALKLLREEYFRNQGILQQFQREAAVLKEIDHPNIVRFYDFVIQSNYAYILTEFIEGYSLHTLIRNVYRNRGAIPYDECIRILVQCMRAIAYLHERHMVHRDIKAANILIQQATGWIFLADFGIVASDDPSNESGFNAGTRSYMAPEQQEHVGLPVTQRSDLYSFAIVAFEVLTGRRPYLPDRKLKGPEAERYMIEQHRSSPVPSISRLRKGLPREMDLVFQRALAKNPDQRYENVRDFVEEIHQILLPQLSSGLHNLDDIGPLTLLPRSVTPAGDQPEAGMAARSWWTLPWVWGAGVVALIAVVILIAGLSGQGEVLTSTATPTATALPDTPTITPTTAEVVIAATDTPTLTATTAPSATPVADTPVPSVVPTAFLDNEVYLNIVEGAQALGTSGTLADALALARSPGTPLIRLNVGPVDGFRVALTLGDDLSSVRRYGIAYHIQDAADYLLFTITPAQRSWEIEDVSGGQSSPVDSGALPDDASLGTLSIMGVGEYFRIEVGPAIIQNRSAAQPVGGLGLWIEMADDNVAPPLQQLQVGLAGPQAFVAATASPTPAQVVGDRDFLLADLNAMLASGDITTATINCDSYLRIYDRLDRYASQAPTIASLAQRLVEAGALISTRCRNERNAQGVLSLNDSFSDYLTWDNALRDLSKELGATSSP